MAKIGIPELMRDIHKGVAPDSVSAAMALTPRLFAVYMVALAMASSIRLKRMLIRRSAVEGLRWRSAPTHMRSIASITFAG